MKLECPELRKKSAGDEIYYWCDLMGHTCILMYSDGEMCEEYEEFLKEL